MAETTPLLWRMGSQWIEVVIGSPPFISHGLMAIWKGNNTTQAYVLGAKPLKLTGLILQVPPLRNDKAGYFWGRYVREGGWLIDHKPRVSKKIEDNTDDNNLFVNLSLSHVGRCGVEYPPERPGIFFSTGENSDGPNDKVSSTEQRCHHDRW